MKKDTGGQLRQERQRRAAKAQKRKTVKAARIRSDFAINMDDYVPQRMSFTPEALENARSDPKFSPEQQRILEAIALLGGTIDVYPGNMPDTLPDGSYLITPDFVENLGGDGISGTLCAAADEICTWSAQEPDRGIHFDPEEGPPWKLTKARLERAAGEMGVDCENLATIHRVYEEGGATLAAFELLLRDRLERRLRAPFGLPS